MDDFRIWTDVIDIAIVLLLLHGPDGREIHISVDAIATIRCRTADGKNEFLNDRINALINTSDGKNVSVIETCEQIRAMLKEQK